MNAERVRAAEGTGPDPGPDPVGDRAAAETARVRQICEHATGHSFGADVIAVRPVPDGRIGVWLNSWPRADEARRALESAGYLVSEMDPAAVHSVGLVVVDGLQVRVSDEQVVEVEIAASSLLVDPVLAELVAEARASRVSLACAARAAVSVRRLGSSGTGCLPVVDGSCRPTLRCG